MLSSEGKRQLYVKEIRKWVPVSPELHKEYYREVGAFRRKQQYRGRCCCPRRKWWLCNTDCLVCEFRTSGWTLSLDAEIDVNREGGTVSFADTIADPRENVEKKIIRNETYAALYREMENLTSDDRRICDFIMEGKTKRESARILGLPWTTYGRRHDKTLAGLRSKLKDYADR